MKHASRDVSTNLNELTEASTIFHDNDAGKKCITPNAITIITPTKNAQVNKLIHGKIQLLQNLKIRGGKE